MNDGEYIKYHQLLGTWFSWLLTNYSVHKKCKSVVPKSYGPLSVAFGFSENADLDDSVILHLFFFFLQGLIWNVIYLPISSWLKSWLLKATWLLHFSGGFDKLQAWTALYFCWFQYILDKVLFFQIAGNLSSTIPVFHDVEETSVDKKL